MMGLSVLGALAVIGLLVLVMSRAEGDETIGFGSSFLIDDGGVGTLTPAAFTVVPKIESLGAPNETTNVTESKTLDLPNARIRKIPSLKDAGTFEVRYQLTAASWARMEAIRDARAVKNFRVVTPVDTGDIIQEVAGIITNNAKGAAEPETINTATLTITVAE